MYYSTKYSSPIGQMLIIGDEKAICGVYFFNQKNFPSYMDYIENDDLTIFHDVKGWFNDYFNGLNPEINFKLKPKGSTFQLKVWKILSKIPYGETVTYGEIASEISPKMSPQAVGGAVSHNPIAVLIPCHRVVGANGKLTGYAAGLDKKVKLLKLESD